MRIALCISGHLRNFKDNFENLKHFILDPYRPDVFLSSWETFGWRTEGNLIQLGHKGFKGFDHYSGRVSQQEIIDLLKPKKYIFENFLDKETEFNLQAEKHKPNCGHPLDRPINTIAMSYKLLSCNQLKTEYELEEDFIYDIVIRTRPDMVYGSQPITNNVLQYINNDFLLTPEIHAYGTASDIFAIGKSKTIDLYSDLYNHLDSINNSGCNMNPHHVLKYYYDVMFPNKWLRYPFNIDLNRCRNSCGTQLWCENCNPSKQILSNIFEEK